MAALPPPKFSFKQDLQWGLHLLRVYTKCLKFRLWFATAFWFCYEAILRGMDRALSPRLDHNSLTKQEKRFAQHLFETKRGFKKAIRARQTKMNLSRRTRRRLTWFEIGELWETGEWDREEREAAERERRRGRVTVLIDGNHHKTTTIEALHTEFAGLLDRHQQPILNRLQNGDYINIERDELEVVDLAEVDKPPIILPKGMHLENGRNFELSVGDNGQPVITTEVELPLEQAEILRGELREFAEANHFFGGEAKLRRNTPPPNSTRTTTLEGKAKRSAKAEYLPPVESPAEVELLPDD